MKEYLLCQPAIDDCISKKRFTIAALYTDQKTLDMHMHDCCEIYFALSDGNRFFIDENWYEISKGDLFVINPYETHHVFEQKGSLHERYVISVHPEFLTRLSLPDTDLSQCFLHPEHFVHKVSLNKEQQRRFLYLIHKISAAEGYGAELLENCAFCELMILVNQLFLQREASHSQSELPAYHHLIQEIMAYIGQNITGDLSLDTIAAHFFISKSYLCRLFKHETGTTISKYVTTRRLNLAKSLLISGYSVSETCEQTGFQNYSNFIKAFTKAVGISPKRYGKYSGI